MAEQLFFPYRFGKHDIRLRIDRVIVDGDIADRVVDPAMRSVGLRGLGEWRNVTLQVCATMDPEQIYDLLPGDEHDQTPCKLILALHCHNTRWRGGIVLAPDREDGTWSGEFELQRSDIRGLAYMTAFLVRTTERQLPTASYANMQNVRLASSGEWRILLDKTELPPGGYLDVRWERFSESDYEKLKAHPARVFYLDYNYDPPVVFLNEEVAGLRPVLEHAGTRGSLVAVRDMVFGAIAQLVWLSLAMQSLMAIPPDEEDPEKEWQQNILARLQPLMPNVPNPAAMARNYNQAGTLIESITAAAQAQEEFDDEVKQLISEVAPS